MDAKFLDTVASAQRQHRHFSKTKTGFVVKHYAGDVEYDASGFAESNRDELRADLLDALLTTGDADIAQLYAEDVAERERLAEELAAGSRRGGSGAVKLTRASD